MACNCATDEYIKRLYKEMGIKSAEKVKMTPEQKAVYYIKKIGLYCVMALVVPILFVYVLYKATFGDGKISFRKFFDLKETDLEDYVRKQQEHQDKD